MKKFIKGCLITGLICVGVGLAVSVTSGFFVGAHTGNEIVRKVIVNGKNVIDFKEKDGVVIKDKRNDDFIEHHGKHNNNNGSECDENCLISLDGIKSVEINVTKAGLLVEGFDKDGVLMDTTDGTSYYVDEDELKIFVEKSDENQKIYVPVNMQDKEIEFVINESEVEVLNVKLNKLSVEANAGSFIANADVATNVDVENIASEVEIVLENNISDYDLEVECITGEVLVDENDFSGVFVEREIKRGNNKSIDIECKAGNVEIHGSTAI